MAEDSAKAESKDKLKFFKKAKDEPAVAVQSDASETENTEAEETAETEKPEAQAGEQAAQTPEPARPEPQKDRAPIMPMVAPTLALAVRTLVILAIIVADAYAAYFLVVKGIAPSIIQAQVLRARAEAAEPEMVLEPEAMEAGAETGMGPGVITPVEDIVINPSGSGGTRYLCTTVAFESIDPAVAAEVAEREPQIRDALIVILSRLTVDDLGSLQTREILREEIKVAVNGLLKTGEVEGVYFSNFVLQ